MNWQHRTSPRAGGTDIHVWWAREGDLILTVDSTREGMYFVQVRNSRTTSSVMNSRSTLEDAQSYALEVAAYPEMQTPQESMLS